MASGAGTDTASAVDGESVQQPTGDMPNASGAGVTLASVNPRTVPLSLNGLCELHCHLDGSLRAETFLELRSKLPSTLAACKAVLPTKPVFGTVDDVYSCLCFQKGWSLQR